MHHVQLLEGTQMSFSPFTLQTHSSHEVSGQLILGGAWIAASDPEWCILSSYEVIYLCEIRLNSKREVQFARSHPDESILLSRVQLTYRIRTEKLSMLNMILSHDHFPNKGSIQLSGQIRSNPKMEIWPRVVAQCNNRSLVRPDQIQSLRGRWI